MELKYKRRIDRFLRVLNSNKKILLIYLTHYRINNDELIVKYCKKLCEKFSSELHFLIIENNLDMEVGRICEVSLAENIYKYNLHTSATSNEQNMTLGQEKYINEIFNNFALKNPFFKIKRKIVKFICVFIPNKNLRKKIKKITKVD